LRPEDRLLVAGSTHGGEEELLLGLHARLLEHCPELRLVLVPRHVERGGEIEKLVERRGWTPIRLTRLRGAAGEGGRIPSTTGPRRRPAVVIADTIGELETFYGIADLVFVGGSLVPIGGHNILEPAGLGKAVLFGPHMDNFEEEARLLREHGAAVAVADLDELAREARRLLEHPEEAEALGQRALEAVRSVRGTTQKTLDLILSHLGDELPGAG
jgi:3-deoxy-D-manno-octulosonic-acid transferase